MRPYGTMVSVVNDDKVISIRITDDPDTTYSRLSTIYPTLKDAIAITKLGSLEQLGVTLDKPTFLQTVKQIKNAPVTIAMARDRGDCWVMAEFEETPLSQFILNEPRHIVFHDGNWYDYVMNASASLTSYLDRAIITNVI